jgi:hypothetical protein
MSTDVKYALLGAILFFVFVGFIFASTVFSLSEGLVHALTILFLVVEGLIAISTVPVSAVGDEG